MTGQAVFYQTAIQKAVPHLSIHSARLYDHGGQFSTILVVNENLIFRFPRYPHVAAALAGEAAALDQLQPSFAPLIPNVIFRNFDAPDWQQAFMGYQMLPGEPLTGDCIAAHPSDAFIPCLSRELADFLRRLHAAPYEQTGIDLPVCNTLIKYSRLYASVQAQLFPYIRPDARKNITTLFETFLNDSNAQAYTPCIRHGDFGTGNILYDPVSKALSGVIDFSFVAIGDPAEDLAGLLAFGQAFFDAVVNAYHASETMVARARFFHATGALQEALDGVRDGDEGAFERGIAGYR